MISTAIPIDDIGVVMNKLGATYQTLDGNEIIYDIQTGVAAIMEHVYSGIKALTTQSRLILNGEEVDEVADTLDGTKALGDDYIDSSMDYSFFQNQDGDLLDHAASLASFCDSSLSATLCSEIIEALARSSYEQLLVDIFEDSADYCELSDTFVYSCSSRKGATMLAGIISSRGGMIYYPAAHYLSSILPNDLSQRAEMDPVSLPAYRSAATFGTRRGVVVILDVTVDAAISAALTSDSELIEAAIDLVRMMANSIIGGMTESDYFSVISTDGTLTGAIVDTDTCVDQDDMSATVPGLVNASSRNKNQELSLLSTYFDALTPTKLSQHDAEDYTYTVAATDEQSPLIQAYKVASAMLHGAIDVSIDIGTVFKERRETIDGSSTSQRDDLSSVRPLPLYSPLQVIVLSLGSTVPQSLQLVMDSINSARPMFHITPTFIRLTTAAEAKRQSYISSSGAYAAAMEKTDYIILHACDSNGGYRENVDVKKFYDLWSVDSTVEPDLNLFPATSAGNMIKTVHQRYMQFSSVLCFSTFRRYGACEESEMTTDEISGGKMCSVTLAMENMPSTVIYDTPDMFFRRPSIVMASPIFSEVNISRGLLGVQFAEISGMDLIELFDVSRLSMFSYSSIYSRTSGRLIAHPSLSSYTNATSANVDVDQLEVFDSAWISGTSSDLTTTGPDTGGTAFTESVVGSVSRLRMNEGSVKALKRGRPVLSVPSTVANIVHYYWHSIDGMDMVIVFCLSDDDITKSIINVPSSKCSDINVDDPVAEETPCYNDSVYTYFEEAPTSIQTEYEYVLGSEVYPVDDLRSSLYAVRSHVTTHIPVDEHREDVIESELGSENNPFRTDQEGMTQAYYQRAISDLSRPFVDETSDTELASIFTKDVINDSLISSIVYPTLVASFEDDDIWQTYMFGAGWGTPRGAYFSMPGFNQGRSFDVRERPWFVSSLYANYELVFSAPFVYTGTSVHSFSLSRRDSLFDEVFAVNTAQFIRDILTDTFTDSVWEGVDGEWQCYLLTHNGMVLFSSVADEDDLLTETTAAGDELFVGEVSPLVFMSLYDADVLVEASSVLCDSDGCVSSTYYQFDVSVVDTPVKMSSSDRIAYTYVEMSSTCTLSTLSDNDTTIHVFSITPSNLYAIAIENPPSSVSAACATASYSVSSDAVSESVVCGVMPTASFSLGTGIDVDDIDSGISDNPVFVVKSMLASSSVSKIVNSEPSDLSSDRSLYYFAPEHILSGKATTQSDVWATGLTFWSIFNDFAIPFQKLCPISQSDDIVGPEKRLDFITAHTLIDSVSFLLPELGEGLDDKGGSFSTGDVPEYISEASRSYLIEKVSVSKKETSMIKIDSKIEKKSRDTTYSHKPEPKSSDSVVLADKIDYIPVKSEPMQPVKYIRKADSFTLVSEDDVTPLCIIGWGNFGEVLLVEVKGLRLPCVLKKLLCIGDERAIKNCRKEFLVQRELFNNPKCFERILRPLYILDLLDKNMKGTYGFLMEFCIGGSVWEFSKSWCNRIQHMTIGDNDSESDSDSESEYSDSDSSLSDYSYDPMTMNPLRVCSLCVGMIECLDDVFTAKSNIIHRDIKPDNFLVRIDPKDGEGTIVLSDFGLANIRANKKGSFAGTLLYMSPEALEYGIQDQKSDAYSLGMAILALFLGEHPFIRSLADWGTDPIELISKLRHLISIGKTPKLFNSELFHFLKTIDCGRYSSVHSCLNSVFEGLTEAESMKRMSVHEARLKVQSIKRFLPKIGEGWRSPSIDEIVLRQLDKHDGDIGEIDHGTDGFVSVQLSDRDSVFGDSDSMFIERQLISSPKSSEDTRSYHKSRESAELKTKVVIKYEISSGCRVRVFSLALDSNKKHHSRKEIQSISNKGNLTFYFDSLHHSCLRILSSDGYDIIFDFGCPKRIYFSGMGNLIVYPSTDIVHEKLAMRSSEAYLFQFASNLTLNKRIESFFGDIFAPPEGISIRDKIESLCEIGAGGFGNVELVRVTNFYSGDSLICVRKLMRKWEDSAKEKSCIDQMRKEFIRQKRLYDNPKIDHLIPEPHVILDHHSSSAPSYAILMEWCRGGSVKDFGKDWAVDCHGCPDPVKLAALSIAIVKCMAKIYSVYTNLVHRDIKPENFLVRVEKDEKTGKNVCSVVLGDLGFTELRDSASQSTNYSFILSKCHERDIDYEDSLSEDDLEEEIERIHKLKRGTKDRNGFVGTFFFNAPETFINLDYSQKSDGWSVGLTIWSLFRNMEVPFSGDPLLGRTLKSRVERLKYLVHRQEALPNIKDSACFCSLKEIMGGKYRPIYYALKKVFKGLVCIDKKKRLSIHEAWELLSSIDPSLLIPIGHGWTCPTVEEFISSKEMGLFF
ncbi:hypothetical protein ADUPG1_010723 [Aduncisulcus paluster]|uniref:Protein kinase domain-containing protein n=1 Tax=Aduncisulcus paluster TaxID=2918883 RepID=A0ABQ5JSK1_9EUKA|nr:hypothetical protein ADUPG1_010723 [Aduncisulcus paluster]